MKTKCLHCGWEGVREDLVPMGAVGRLHCPRCHSEAGTCDGVPLPGCPNEVKDSGVFRNESAANLARAYTVWESAEKAAKMAQFDDCEYPYGFVLDIAEVMVGIKPPPEPNGSTHSNFVRKALGL